MAIEKEFLVLLKRNSRAVPVVTIQDILNGMVENAGSSYTGYFFDTALHKFYVQILIIT